MICQCSSFEMLEIDQSACAINFDKMLNIIPITEVY